jgi:hypothetical protein
MEDGYFSLSPDGRNRLVPRRGVPACHAGRQGVRVNELLAADLLRPFF